MWRGAFKSGIAAAARCRAAVVPHSMPRTCVKRLSDALGNSLLRNPLHEHRCQAPCGDSKMATLASPAPWPTFTPARAKQGASSTSLDEQEHEQVEAAQAEHTLQVSSGARPQPPKAVANSHATNHPCALSPADRQQLPGICGRL